MQTLDAKLVPLQGTNLIEASAGTGKTWTISWLYLRLIAVQGLKVDQILVVTYTDAATAELRDRIRRRLADALAYLQGRAHEDTYPSLLQEVDVQDGIRRLYTALVSFDEAAVFTIHGFCKRVLTDNAFEARVRFESELVANEDSLLTELTDQFWYHHFLQPDILKLSLLKKHNLTPDSLLADIRNFIGKPYLYISIPAVESQDFSQLHAAFFKEVDKCASLWIKERKAIYQVLSTALLQKVLNGRVYSEEKLHEWGKVLDQLFAERVVSGQLDDVLEKYSTEFLKRKINKNKTPPTHSFFERADKLLIQYRAMQELLPIGLEALRLSLLQHLRRTLPLRKQQLGVLTFDDLLLHLREALDEHPHFAQRLADKYKAALIDEFQDTDPVQYAIFNRIYQNQPELKLFFVGDPKQAIYGFRGADIYTYLKAAKAAEYHYTLGQNFRSHAHFLQALNHLFQQTHDPFRSEIAYEAVQAGRSQDELRLEPALASLRIWDWDNLADGFTTNHVQDQVAEAVADDIARLLNAAKAGQAWIGLRPVESRDIAVLVRENRQGERVKQALLVRGIASVQKSRDSIFHTREATELRAFLRAVAEPSNEYALKQALVTELVGYNAVQLYALEQQPELLEAELEAFHAWHLTWQNRGFMPMFRQWMVQKRRYAHLLALADGERRLTNLLHLAELIHTESTLKCHGMHTVIRWLQQKADSDIEDEAYQLRLESDENLVQIVTIHKSKGLEYGIVYCPYVWKEKEPRRHPSWFSWYDNVTGTSCLQAYALAQDSEKDSAREAEKAESLRLLYVALTRAKYHCTLVLASGNISQFDYYSALTWLLFGSMPQANDVLGRNLKDSIKPEKRQQLMHTRLREILASAEGLIQHESLPLTNNPLRYQTVSENGVVRIRTFTQSLPPVPKVGSFSGLTAGKHEEKPDYDGGVTTTLRPVDPVAFPRGAQAGSCLHKMLEELDFTLPLSEQRKKILQPALKRHGLAETWQEAAELLVTKTLTTILPMGLTLQQLPKTKRLDELEFYFPVKRLKLQALQRLLHQHLPLEWEEIHNAINRLQFQDLTGFMKGYIDLIFEEQGQFYIVDYKSNDLGNRAQDYAFIALQQAMAEHHYYLQYLIYSLALHRYLKLRLEAYSWDVHVGGVLYLFLRGMDPAIPNSGVFFHKPDRVLIEALDELMRAGK